MNYDLNRFIQAQENCYRLVIQELKNGKKEGHWIWFIFPQIKGLGYSFMSESYAIQNIEEAKNYLNHPILSARLKECCEILLRHNSKKIEAILGSLDALKLRSSMTLFQNASPNDSVFTEILDVFYDGVTDYKTLELLP